MSSNSGVCVIMILKSVRKSNCIITDIMKMLYDGPESEDLNYF